MAAGNSFPTGSPRGNSSPNLWLKNSLVDFDERHRRVLEQLILRGPLSFERLQSLAKLRRSDDDFGLILGDLAERRGKRNARKPVEWWPDKETRLYAVRPEVIAAMVTDK